MKFTAWDFTCPININAYVTETDPLIQGKKTAHLAYISLITAAFCPGGKNISISCNVQVEMSDIISDIIVQLEK